MSMYRLCSVSGVTILGGLTVVAGDGVGDTSIPSPSSVADLDTRLIDYFLYRRG
jgi:hypothetical protein